MTRAVIVGKAGFDVRDNESREILTAAHDSPLAAIAAAENLPACAECGDVVTEAQLAEVRRDVDFVQHGNRGHLIRLEER